MGEWVILASGNIRRIGLAALRFSEVIDYALPLLDASDCGRSRHRFEVCGLLFPLPDLHGQPRIASARLRVVLSQ